VAIDDRLERVEENVSSIRESVARLEVQARNSHELLLQHDKKGTRALEKAEELESRMDANDAFWQAPVKWASLIGKIAAGIAAAYGVWNLIP
jgi:hypothetical protein